MIKKLLMKYHKSRMEYWDNQWWNEYHKTGKGFYEQNYKRMVHQEKYTKLKEDN